MSGLRVAAGAALPWTPTPTPDTRRGLRPSADRPELTVVPDSRSPLAVRVVVGLAVVALFASLLGLAVFHTMLVESQATIDELDTRIAAVEAETESLQVAITQGEAPEQILAEAERLGMVPAGDVVVVDATEVRPAG